MPPERPIIAERIARIEAMLNDGGRNTRISADLRPLMLDDLGLAAAVEWVIQEFTDRSDADCKVVIEGSLDLEDPHATAVFRVLQESLTNIAKHAGATTVNVQITRTAEKVYLRVQDNGIGFSLESPRKRNSHGLLGVRERAYLLGGDSRIVSAPGEGTSGIVVAAADGNSTSPSPAWRVARMQRSGIRDQSSSWQGPGFRLRLHPGYGLSNLRKITTNYDKYIKQIPPWRD